MYFGSLIGDLFMKNKDLKSRYDNIYKDGAYENFYTFNMFPSEMLILNFIDNFVASVFFIYLDSVNPLKDGCINEPTSLN